MPLFNYFVRPRPVPLVMSVFAVLLMFSLGVWQLQRLAWKEALIARIEQAVATTPYDALPMKMNDIQPLEFYHFRLSGHYLQGHEFHLAARYYKSQLGYHVFNPFQLEDGRIVLVNRGWIHSSLKDANKHAAIHTDPQTLTLQLRLGDDRNPFTPPNDPARNVWFGRDMAEMASVAQLKVEPYSFDLIGTQDRNQLPIPSSGKIALRNDHLGYAITWFGIGFAALIISLLYHRKKPAA